MEVIQKTKLGTFYIRLRSDGTLDIVEAVNGIVVIEPVASNRIIVKPK